MDTVTFTLGELYRAVLAASLGVTTVAAAIGVISKIVLPRRAMKAKLDDHERQINGLEAGHKIICKSLLALLDQAATGNSVERVKSARDDMQAYLTER